MAIILRNVKNKDLVFDSNKIIGVMGNEYEQFLSLLKGKNIYLLKKEEAFIKENVYDELCYDEKLNNNLQVYLQELGLEEEFINKKISDLSSGEKRLLQYLKMLIHRKTILVIEEPFLNLDYNFKKKIICLLKKLKNNKTIIIGSNNANDIYYLSDKVLFIKENNLYCNDTITAFTDSNVLKEFQIDTPSIVEFVNYAHLKGVNLSYSKDIRDLIKEVYKNV